MCYGNCIPFSDIFYRIGRKRNSSQLILIITNSLEVIWRCPLFPPLAISHWYFRNLTNRDYISVFTSVSLEPQVARSFLSNSAARQHCPSLNVYQISTINMMYLRLIKTGWLKSNFIRSIAECVNIFLRHPIVAYWFGTVNNGSKCLKRTLSMTFPIIMEFNYDYVENRNESIVWIKDIVLFIYLAIHIIKLHIK